MTMRRDKEIHELFKSIFPRKHGEVCEFMTPNPDHSWNFTRKVWDATIEKWIVETPPAEQGSEQR